MFPALKKIIEGLVGMVTFIIVLRLLLVPTYAFIHHGNGTIFTMLLIPESIIAAFAAYMVVRYIHKHL